MRRFLYRLLRVLNDGNAAVRGKAGARLVRRAYGRATGKAAGKYLSKFNDPNEPRFTIERAGKMKVLLAVVLVAALGACGADTVTENTERSTTTTTEEVTTVETNAVADWVRSEDGKFIADWVNKAGDYDGQISTAAAKGAEATTAEEMALVVAEVNRIAQEAFTELSGDYGAIQAAIATAPEELAAEFTVSFSKHRDSYMHASAADLESLITSTEEIAEARQAIERATAILEANEP